MKLVALPLLLASTAAGAGELLLHVGSWHSDRKYVSDVNDPWGRITTFSRPYNNLNLGVGYVTKSGWAFGTFRNSFYQQTVYVGHSWSRQAGHAEVGVTAALMTGYKPQTGRSLQPMLGLTLGVPLTQSLTLRLSGIPSVDRDSANVLHLTIGYRL